MSAHDLPPRVRPPAPAVVVPVVPGYRVHRLLGAGGSGRVWAATAPDGADVAVKVLTGAPGAHPGALAAEADLLAELDHPCVVRLREVVETSSGPALVMDRAEGGSLAALVAVRGALQPGEVVTVVSVLAGALVDLHARGLVHGDLSPANVLLGGDGAPLLADWGLATLVGLGAPWADEPAPPAGAAAPVVRGRRSAARSAQPAPPGTSSTVMGTPGYADPARAPGAPPGPAGDVHALAAVGWFALTGAAPPSGQQLGAAAPGAPAELVAALAAALDPDPARRPDAAALARRCADAAPPAPVHLVPGAGATAPEDVITHRLRAAAAAAAAAATEPEPRRRARSGRGVVVAVALLAAGGAAGLALVHALDAGPPQPPRTPPAASTAPATAAAAAPAPAPARGSTTAPPRGEEALTGPDPAAAVGALADLRARAYREGDPRLLERVDAAGSAPAAVDAGVLRRLAATGEDVEDLSFTVESADVVDATGGQAWVRAQVVTSAHRLRGPGGVVTEVPASAPVTSLLLLTREGGRWRVTGSG